MAAGINNENQNVTLRGNKIINRSQTPPKNQLSAQNHELTLYQRENNYKQTGMLGDNKQRPLNPDPCLPMFSERATNRSDTKSSLGHVMSQ